MAHPLDGCCAKLNRAQETIETLDGEIKAFVKNDPNRFEIFADFQKAFEDVFKVRGDPDPPLRFAVIAGEVVHHLRSALDHLLYALIVNNGFSPTKNAQFPICDNKEFLEKACKRGRIQGTNIQAKLLIESAQPYPHSTPKCLSGKMLNWLSLL
jgi:hypothetical protein